MDREDVFVLGFIAVVVFVSLTIGMASAVYFIGADPVPDRTTVDVDKPAEVIDYSEVYDESKESIVLISTETSTGNAQGSGFVYTEDGYIVTNQHVVGDADNIYVQYENNKWTKADIVGVDVYTDIAVLEPENPQDVEPLPMRNGVPNTGEPAISIGAPGGLEGSVTVGVVSGTERAGRTTTGFMVPDMVQTDAALNPGNSGGPLFDRHGNVIGVSRSKQGENIGLAVSSRLTVTVADSLIQTGEHSHAYMGVQTSEVTPSIAEELGQDTTQGIVVRGTVSDGPSDGVFNGTTNRVKGNEVEVEYGDIILAVEDTEIQTNQDLGRYLMLNTEPGDTVDFTILRDGEKQTVSVTLGERPDPSEVIEEDNGGGDGDGE